MAEVKKTAAKEDLVPVKLFRDDSRYTDDVFVGVNGKTWIIKRGVEVMVPRCVKEVLKHAEDQREMAAMNTDKLQADFESASRSYGIDI